MSCAILSHLSSSHTPISIVFVTLIQKAILIHLLTHLYTGGVTFHLHLIKEHSLLTHDTKCLLLLRLDKTVNNRVKEYTSNTNGTSKKLHGIKRLSKDKGYTDNNDDTLGSIGY